MKLDEARVLLTGASGGIGRAMARALRAAGAQVLGAGRGDAVDALPWVRADLLAPEGLARVARAAADWDANVVVHAAGLPAFGAFAEAPAARLEATLRTNLLAPMLLTQALLPALQRRAAARIVFVGSAVGRIGLPGFAAYGAGKGGLALFAEALRRELAGTPVRVQLLGPRSTRTGFNDAAVEAYNRATGTAMDPPEAVAAALVALLASDAAERWIGFPEKLAVRLNGAIGPALDGAFTRHRRQVAGAATPALTGGQTP